MQARQSETEAPAYECDARGPVLKASRCLSCAAVIFPAAASCSQCGGEEMREEVLPREGRLWTWTTQSIRPKSPPYAGAETPEEYQPFLVGYMQFDDGVCVAGRLVGVTAATARIGERMEIVETGFAVAAAGRPVSGYAFAPLASGVRA